MAAENDVQMNRSTVISLLYLASLIGGIPSLIGVILAYIWRSEGGEPWEASHFRYHIRTFWLGIGWFLIGLLLIIVGVGILILALLPVWFAIRGIRALLAAQRREPIPNPETWYV